MSQAIKAIETRYAGCRFRSRLEARWAVFFDTLGIKWEYEPEGFNLSTGPYLPDFFLPECGTWIEVKGDLARVDYWALLTAAIELPVVKAHPGCEQGPKLILLGPIPKPPAPERDWGWLCFYDYTPEGAMLNSYDESGYSTKLSEGDFHSASCCFGPYLKNHRPWAVSVYCSSNEDSHLFSPFPTDPEGYGREAHAGYTAARSARFEHGERP